jgi:hypothetical protein
MDASSLSHGTDADAGVDSGRNRYGEGLLSQMVLSGGDEEGIS